MAISRQFFKFFDKLGNDLNPQYDAMYDSWYAKMHFPKISANLNESEHIFLLEEVVNLQPTKAQLGFSIVTNPIGQSYFTGVNSFSIEGALIESYTFQFQYFDVNNNEVLLSITDNGSGILLDQNGNNVSYFTREGFGTLRPIGSSQYFLPVMTQATSLIFRVRLIVADSIGNNDSSIWFNYGDTTQLPAPPNVILPEVSTVDVVFPSTNYPNRTFRARFLEGGDDEIYLYTVDHSNGDFPLIVKSDSTVFTNIRDGSLDPTDPITGHRMVTDFLSQALQINIGCSGEEGIYERSLIIEEVITNGNGTIAIDTQIGIQPDDGSTVSIFALIDFYAEVEGEDVRFRKILENFGKKINSEETFVFREVDIEEDLPDWRILNYKRKELLLEGDNIYPYIGAYKGLLNAINFFGYYDLQLKEYWLNIDTSSPNYLTYRQVTVTNTDGSISFSDRFLPSKNFKKTALFGLFYPINQVTGEYDAYGLPITEDASVFTPDEVLYKLFGLKNILKREFLPFNARIIDICGEGIYFQGYTFRHWCDNVTILEKNQNITPEFIVTSDSLIIDLRPYSFNTDNDNPGLTAQQNVIIADYQNTIVGTFNDYAQPLLYGDDPEGELVGCPVTVTNTSFNYVFDDLQGSWDSFLHFSWDDLNSGNFYECEWIIEQKGATPFYQSSGRDTIINLMTWSTNVPFIGDYNITLKLYDTNNNTSIRIIQDALTVISYQIEISALYRSQSFRETWDSQTGTWDEQNSSWSDPVVTQNASWDDFQISWDNLSWYRYIDQSWTFNPGVYDTAFATSHLGTNFNWNQMNLLTWDNLQGTSWDMLEAHGDTYCGFIIKDFEVGGTITIEGDGFTPFVMSGIYGATWEGLLKELNESTLPGFSDFYYQIMGGQRFTGDFNPDYNSDHDIDHDTIYMTQYIHANAKHHGIQFLYAFQFANGMESEYEDSAYGNSYPLVNSLLWDADESLPAINHPPNWDYIYRTYQEWKGDHELNNIQTITDWYTAGSPENYRIPVNAAISGYFQWQDCQMQNNYFQIQTGVPLVFVYDKCKIPGKKNARWRVYDETMKLLCDINHSFLMWTPSSTGRLIIQLDLEDSNGNLTSKLITNL